MRHEILLNFLWVCLAVILGGSCKKDRVFPEVSIKLPAEGTVYDFGDTILVRAIVDKADEGIIPSIIKGAQSSGLPYNIYDHTGNEYIIFFYYNNRYLEGGQYDIRVTAYNGDNESSGFKRITLTPLPKRFRGVAVLSGDGSGRVVSRSDSAGVVKSFNLSGDHAHIACSGSFNQIISVPFKSGNLVSLEFDDLKTVYTRPNPNTQGSVQYRNVYAFDQEVYALLEDDRVFRLNENGLIEINFSLQDPYVPYLARKLGNDRLVIAARQESKD
ncbi:MAG: hypothetical protein ACPF9D_08290, partial [Owenweeksia sp.]